LPENQAHDEFLELCALAASAQLDDKEQLRLSQHLAECPACREALEQYKAIIEQVIPAVAAEQGIHGQTASGREEEKGHSFSGAEEALFDRIAQERERAGAGDGFPDLGRANPADNSAQTLRFSGEEMWRRVWLSYAAAIALCVTLGIAAYRAGKHQSPTTAQSAAPATVAPAVDGSKELGLEEQLSDVSHERALAQAQIQSRDRTISELRLQLQQATAALKRVASVQDSTEQASGRRTASGGEDAEQRAELKQQLSEAQTKVEQLQARLNALNQQLSQDKVRTAVLEAEVNELTRRVQERDAAVDQQQELLAHDRDIRELMCHRQLKNPQFSPV
jgi:hypothetical protein